MAVTQAQIDAIKAARNTGALRVRYGDEETTYRSLEEMDRIIASLEQELAGTTNEPRATLAWVERD